MAWEEHQQYRLAVERRLLQAHMPDFDFYEPTGDTYVSGSWQSSRQNWFRIVVLIPPAFPEECPGCYIARPSPLMGRDQALNDYGNSHDMHVWATDRSDWTKICTYRPERWSAAHSLLKVIQKAMLWVEAYESHLETGRPIAAFLLDME